MSKGPKFLHLSSSGWNRTNHLRLIRTLLLPLSYGTVLSFYYTRLSLRVKSRFRLSQPAIHLRNLVYSENRLFNGLNREITTKFSNISTLRRGVAPLTALLERAVFLITPPKVCFRLVLLFHFITPSAFVKSLSQ